MLEKTEGQLRMYNPEKQAKLATHYTGGRQTKQKHNTATRTPRKAG